MNEMHKKIAWILPSPFQGGGGYRTILNKIKKLELRGFAPYLFISPSPDTDFDNARQNIKTWYGYDFANINLVSELSDDFDVVIATFWTTAFAADTTNILTKLYFCQDYEPYFYPVGDDYLEARKSYELGLQPICLGKWLSQKISSISPIEPLLCEFGVDEQVYFPKEVRKKEHSVCAIFQPEKYRRVSKLLIDTIAIINQIAPEIKVCLYGSKGNENLIQGINVEYLEIISTTECNDLYNRCKLGISLSTTNPSRIPFEMMASGLPVVELDMPSNKLDLPSGAIEFVEYDPMKMAHTVCSLIDSDQKLNTMSSSGINFMKGRNFDFENDTFSDQVIKAIERSSRQKYTNSMQAPLKKTSLLNRDIVDAQNGLFCFRTPMIKLSISGLSNEVDGLIFFIWSTVDQRDLIKYQIEGFNTENLAICLDLPPDLNTPTRCFFHIYSIRNQEESFLFGFEHFFITTDNRSSGRNRNINLSGIGMNCEMTAL